MSIFATVGGGLGSIFGSIIDFFVWDASILIPTGITLLVILFMIRTIGDPYQLFRTLFTKDGFNRFFMLIVIAIASWIIYLVWRSISMATPETLATVIFLVVLIFAIWRQKK